MKIICPKCRNSNSSHAQQVDQARAKVIDRLLRTLADNSLKMAEKIVELEARVKLLEDQKVGD